MLFTHPWDRGFRAFIRGSDCCLIVWSAQDHPQRRPQGVGPDLPMGEPCSEHAVSVGQAVITGRPSKLHQMVQAAPDVEPAVRHLIPRSHRAVRHRVAPLLPLGRVSTGDLKYVRHLIPDRPTSIVHAEYPGSTSMLCCSTLPNTPSAYPAMDHD